MASLAEIKVGTTYFLARVVGERLVPPLLLTVREATLESAAAWDTQHGNFRESATNFYSVLQSSQEGEEKSAALIGLVQELINLGRFRQARRFLTHEPPRLFSDLPALRKLYCEARVSEKFGWIADYEGGYFNAIECFMTARDLILRIPQHEWRKDDEEALFSTTTHFLGRAHLGLAAAGVGRERNVGIATSYFQQDLHRFRKAREEGHPTPANEGFQHAWLARCHMMLRDLDQANQEIEQAGQFFREYTGGQPEKSAIMAHYHLLKGRLFLLRNLPPEARAQFQEALRIRTEIQSYPKGLADAAAGMAVTYWKEKRVLLFLKYTTIALRAHPFVIKNILGG